MNILASIGKDKWMHFTVSLVLEMFIYAILFIWLNIYAAPVAIAVPLALGIIRSMSTGRPMVCLTTTTSWPTSSAHSPAPCSSHA